MEILKVALTKNNNFIDQFVKQKPDLGHLSKVANQFLLTLLDVPFGLHYLIQNRYFEEEFTYWFEHGIFQYATLVELVLENPSSCEM